ncbi:unnamed protein product, partial [Amoebophrya sp. A120]|eukprot:GSA120T00010694001.1
MENLRFLPPRAQPLFLLLLVLLFFFPSSTDALLQLKKQHKPGNKGRSATTAVLTQERPASLLTRRGRGGSKNDRQVVGPSASSIGLMLQKDLHGDPILLSAGRRSVEEKYSEIRAGDEAGGERPSRLLILDSTEGVDKRRDQSGSFTLDG